MDSTDWLLLLIAALIGIGLVLYWLQGRARAHETELIRAALYATGNRRQEISARDAIPVTLDPSVNKAIARFAKTAVDLQGMIELAARYMVTQIPAEAVEDMDVPEDWPRMKKAGLYIPPKED